MAEHVIHKTSCSDVLKKKLEVIETSEYIGDPNEVMLFSVCIGGDVNDMLVKKNKKGHITKRSLREIITSTFLCKCCVHKPVPIRCPDGIFDGATIIVPGTFYVETV